MMSEMLSKQVCYVSPEYVNKLTKRIAELGGRLRDRQNALDHAIDYGKRIDRHIAKLETVNNSVRVCKAHVSEIADPRKTDCLVCRIAELEQQLMSVSDGAAMTDMKKDKRIAELEDELDSCRAVRDFMREREHHQIAELKATIEHVKPLPVKWISEAVGVGVKPKDGDAKLFCAYELQAALQQEPEHE